MEEMDIQTHTKAVFEPTKKHHSPSRFAMRFSLRMYTKNNKKQLNWHSKSMDPDPQTSAPRLTTAHWKSNYNLYENLL